MRQFSAMQAVGMPYDGDLRATYLLIEDGRPSIRRVEYDVEREARELRASNYPYKDWLADILLTGKYSRPPEAISARWVWNRGAVPITRLVPLDSHGERSIAYRSFSMQAVGAKAQRGDARRHRLRGAAPLRWAGVRKHVYRWHRRGRGYGGGQI